MDGVKTRLTLVPAGLVAVDRTVVVWFLAPSVLEAVVSLVFDPVRRDDTLTMTGTPLL